MLATLTTDQQWIDGGLLSTDHTEDRADMLKIFTAEDGSTGPNRTTRTNTLAARARTRIRSRNGLAAGTSFIPGRERAVDTSRGNGVPRGIVSPVVRRGSAGTAENDSPAETRAQDVPSVEQIVAKAVEQMAAKLEAQNAHRISTPVRISEDPRSEMTLRALYESELKAERTRRVDVGRNKSGTADKDLSALSFWERTTSNPTLASIDAGTLQTFITNALRTGRRSTARGYVGHLRWMLNEAKRRGIIESVAAFEFPKVSRRTVNEEHRETLIYELDGDLLGTLDKINAGIESTELRLAFVCGASFGPRTEDLLTLKWCDFDLIGERPVVRFVAEKTGTFHVVPLAGWLVALLQASQLDETHVFPTLISHKSKDPRKSHASRRTVAALRDAAAAAGFKFGERKAAEQKPFQVLRATCNERFERHHRRAGEWILGHAMNGVNRKSYQNPGSDIYKAVQTLPQPQSFLKGLPCSHSES